MRWICRRCVTRHVSQCPARSKRPEPGVRCQPAGILIPVGQYELVRFTPVKFALRRSAPLATITYRRAWDRARRSALSDEECRSPLARRPYDLRHACLSTWLNGE
jgi:integrase